MTTYYIEKSRNIPMGQIDSGDLDLPILGPSASSDVVPSLSLKRLMQACYEVLMAGITYQDEFEAAVAEKLDDIKPEKGFEESFGTDVYYMRKAVEARMKLKANREALQILREKHDFTVDREWKGKISIGGENFSRVTIERFDDDDGMIVFRCTKRGSRKRWTARVNANSSSLLSQLGVGDVTDDVVQEIDSGAPGISSLAINPSANVRKELVCQL